MHSLLNSFEELGALKNDGKLETSLIPVDAAFSYEKIKLPEIFSIPLKNGAKMERTFLNDNDIALDDSKKYLFYNNNGDFVGIYHFDDEFCRPYKMFYTEN